LYEKFQQIITFKGITSYRVAKDTGISTTTLSDWKHGKSKPKADKLIKLADYLGVSLDYLVRND
jgi:repressor LexA